MIWQCSSDLKMVLRGLGLALKVLVEVKVESESESEKMEELVPKVSFDFYSSSRDL